MANEKALEILFVFAFYISDERFRCDTEFLSFQHDCRTVRIISTYINALVALKALKSRPDVRLNVLQHVTKVY